MRATMILTACAIVVTGCGPKENKAAADSAAQADSAAKAASMAPSTPAGATAMVMDAAGHELGSLTLADGSGGITVSGTLKGLAPGDHGIHVHTVGMCEGPAYTTAGGHWNPTTKMHGKDNPAGPHLGDMMNITVGADSTATVQITTMGGSLHGADMLMDADGAAVVVHAKADDYKTDPSGNSGDRIACGVIKGS
ncbi:MAG: superoxide dismutase family protein [Gemmatimonadaceae bacterium]